ncbi:RagB/SusD family nutrient uptake outer membrane protein [Sphingobacterium sp. UT-1RO-CII-1]|uniref:RagB/SusD family nutrient uptake outer membrane protein n=1 Tax=Sphingobacterium sp. UT-1RO-CII-1 TaxID=2995225 RepID=UPI00227AD406|nr:RagB/SusD family nutrient uptake outer membrane protein [Sphingobacterium sp. UT-1RO-CII-1]MCY4780310.1 RagB/SusD family nutrient uptake outer membrane protein [Sphingobacterium sp. UT-1RO-CII-1]
MKIRYNLFTYGLAGLLGIFIVTSCNKNMDISPPSQITPEDYLTEESQLAAYAVGRYPDLLPSHGGWGFGIFGIDANTDNMVVPDLNNRFIPGEWRVGTSGGDWSFGNIYQMNYFFNRVLPLWKENKITGSAEGIAHYIGEMYFLRAVEYFNKLQSLGDFPIVRTAMSDKDPQLLVETSKRAPRTEVARFILSDLDSAITLLKTVSPDGAKQRISKNVAYLLKSRVALYEGTWLKYFKGTAYVPNGTNWPGASKEYNKGYQFQSGSIESEIEFFLKEAMTASQVVADNVPLVNNTGIIESHNNENPYFSMFGALDMSGYSEVLLWRQYNESLSTHNVPVYAQLGNYGVGLTRSMVESFLMKNGLPIYAAGSGYHGDDYISDVRKDRDGRLVLFLKEPGQKNILVNLGLGTHGTPIEPKPRIFETNVEKMYSSGYTIRKGISYDGAQTNNGSGFTGSIAYRAVEAYLNYMEACYELHGSLDNKAQNYWIAIRKRAAVSEDFNKTIAATDINKEKRDWGVYSAGNFVSPTLYNIRRERRSELMAEGLRLMDLKRWRAMDQLINAAVHFEGFKLWGPMKDWYTKDQLVYGATNEKAVVSDPALGEYLRPQEIRSNALSYNGARFVMPHYLAPIAVEHFQLTSSDGSIEQSVIYQNPGWPTVAGAGVTAK